MVVFDFVDAAVDDLPEGTGIGDAAQKIADIAAGERRTQTAPDSGGVHAPDDRREGLAGAGRLVQLADEMRFGGDDFQTAGAGEAVA